MSPTTGAVVGKLVTERVDQAQMALAISFGKKPVDRVRLAVAQTSEVIVATAESPARDAHEKLVIPREACTHTSEAKNALELRLRSESAVDQPQTVEPMSLAVRNPAEVASTVLMSRCCIMTLALSASTLTAI
jgi:hypothetical protein